MSEARSSSRSYIQRVLDTSLDAIAVIDAHGCVQEWNAQAERTFGWTRDEIAGRLLWDAVIPERNRRMHARAFDRFAATAQDGVKTWRMEVTAMRRDRGEFPGEMAVSDIEAESGHSFCVCIRDVSIQKREEALRNAILDCGEALRAASNLNELFFSVYRILSEFLRVDSFYVALKQAVADEPLVYCFSDSPQSESGLAAMVEGFSASGRIVEATAERMESCGRKCDDALREHRDDPDWFAAPLVFADVPIGVMAIRSSDGNASFGGWESDFFRYLSGQLASAVEHKRCVEEQKQALASLERTCEERMREFTRA